MNGVLRGILEVSVLAFPVSSLLAAGLAHTPKEIFGPLRQKHRIVRALIANFLLVPLLALGVSRLLSLDRPLEVGLLLLSSGAGAPFLIKLTQAAGGDVALSASLLVVLVPGTVLFMPLVVPWIEPQARVSAQAIAVPLTLTLLVPLAVGLWVRGRSARVAAGLGRLMARLSSVSLVLLLVLTLLLNLRRFAGIFGSGAILATFAVILGAFLIGVLVSSPNRSARTTLGLGTAQRNIAAAMVVASESFHNPDTLVLVVTASVVDLLVLFPIAWALRRHKRRSQPPRPAPDSGPSPSGGRGRSVVRANRSLRSRLQSSGGPQAHGHDLHGEDRQEHHRPGEAEGERTLPPPPRVGRRSAQLGFHGVPQPLPGGLGRPGLRLSQLDVALEVQVAFQAPPAAQEVRFERHSQRWVHDPEVERDQLLFHHVAAHGFISWRRRPTIWWMRDLTVPKGIASTVASSSYERPSARS